MLSSRQFLRQRKLASDGRAGEWARGKARREQYEFVQRNWRRLAVLGIGSLLPPAVMAFFLPLFASGMLLGGAFTAVLGLLAFYVVQATGTAPIMAGDGAEQWTAQELRRLKRRGWRLVNHFNLSDQGDIDHVLLGPSGALAVETRWSAEPWRFNDAGDSRLTEKVSQARTNARRLEMWQPFRGDRIPVRPVVMLWGRGLSDWPEGICGFLIDGVQVVAGPRAKLWRRSLSEQALLSDAQINEVWAAIDKQAEQRDEHDRSKWPVPPSPLALYARGLATLAAFIGGLLVTGRLLQLPLWVGSACCAVLLLVGGLAAQHRATRLVAAGWLAGVTTTLVVAAIALAVAWTGAL